MLSLTKDILLLKVSSRNWGRHEEDSGGGKGQLLFGLPLDEFNPLFDFRKMVNMRV
jgi:hypothetical protein